MPTARRIAGFATIGAAIAAVALTAGVAVARTDPSTPVRIVPFTVVEHAVTDTTTDTGAKGDSVGDILTFHNPVYDERNNVRVGTDNGSCLRTKVGYSYECMWTTKLSGGSIVVEGPFYDHYDSNLAITGGTGMYGKVRGRMILHALDKAGTQYDFTFEVHQY